MSVIALVTLALGGCGDGSGDSVTGTAEQPAPGKPRVENNDEPPIPPGTELCPDLQLGNGEYVAFRITAKDASCDSAAVVVNGALEDSPPKGWSCTQESRHYATCTKGPALVGFND